MYSTLDQYASFTEQKEHYKDIIDDKWFPPLYFYESPVYSIQTHRFSLNDPIKPFHQETKSKIYGDQEIAIITIPTNKDEYRFYTDCCKLDAVSYLKQDSILDAVGINGVFYQFQTDSVPLGGYKQGDKEVIRPLQPVYESFYRAITISHKGKLDIHSAPFSEIWKERNSYHSMMACAPMLIDQGQIVITDELLSNYTDEGIHVFQCEISKPFERGMNVERNGKHVKSCSNNLPGGLFHISNTNPRSVIITDQKGNVYFMRVAGRIEGVLGMDLVQVAQTIKRYIPDAWMAINLDGGAPSQLLHKTNGNVISTTNQHSHTGKSTILIGNLLTYMKVTDSFSPHSSFA